MARALCFLFSVCYPPWKEGEMKRFPRWLCAIAALALLVVLLAACGPRRSEPTPAPAAELSATAEVKLFRTREPTPLPTRTPVPTRSPTRTPLPTRTAAPTRMPSATPTYTATPTPTATPSPDAIVVANTLNLRGGPGTDYETLTQLSQGDELFVVGQQRGCEWVKVSSVSDPDSIGWVAGSGNFLELRLACEVIPRGTFRPLTGVIKPNARGGGLGELEVENGTPADGVVILTVNDDPVTAAFVRGGESVNLVGIRDGVYTLFFTTGSDWDGDRFTLDARYQRFEDLFEFTTSATAYTTWSVTLHGVVGGTASTEGVDQDEFPNLGDG